MSLPVPPREPSEEERVLAKVYHDFTLGHMDWPHSEVPPRVQPNVCWPCWNFASHAAAALAESRHD